MLTLFWINFARFANFRVLRVSAAELHNMMSVKNSQVTYASHHPWNFDARVCNWVHEPGYTRAIVIRVVPAGGANVCYNCCLGVPSKWILQTHRCLGTAQCHTLVVWFAQTHHAQCIITINKRIKNTTNTTTLAWPSCLLTQNFDPEQQNTWRRKVSFESR